MYGRFAMRNIIREHFSMPQCYFFVNKFSYPSFLYRLAMKSHEWFSSKVK